MLKPERFTASDGTEWEYYDFRVDELPGGSLRRVGVTLNSEHAEYRAFRSGNQVLCYRFGRIAYRMTDLNVLEDQLRHAKDLRATLPRAIAVTPAPDSAAPSRG